MKIRTDYSGAIGYAMQSLKTSLIKDYKNVQSSSSKAQIAQIRPSEYQNVSGLIQSTKICAWSGVKVSPSLHTV
jgi:hypothetical protein